MGVLAVIPARGGSKGIPRKNLRLLCGTPLVVHAIRTALAAKRIDRVVLSTDDDEIAVVGSEAGAEVIMRPPHLADDVAPTIPVLQHAIDTLADGGWQAKVVVVLEPTSPFRSAATVDACVAKLDDDKVQSAITVTQLERNPYNIFTVNNGRAVRFIREPEGVFTRRQQFTHLKRLNGCVYVTRADLVRSGCILGEPMQVVEMTGEESINIDTPLDMEIANLVATQIWADR